MLLSNGRHRVVVDTGLPHEAHQLVGALKKRGLQPSDVGMVINTHFHVDHVLNNSLFPQSVIYAPQESYDWSRSLYSDLLVDVGWEKLVLKYYPQTFDYERARNNMGKLRKFALRWWNLKRLGSAKQFRWMETNPLPEGLEVFMTSGHVPGHASVLVRTGKATSVIAGDALLSRANDDQVLTMIPVDRKQFELDRARILSLSSQIVPGHDQEFSQSAPGPAIS